MSHDLFSPIINPEHHQNYSTILEKMRADFFLFNTRISPLFQGNSRFKNMEYPKICTSSGKYNMGISMPRILHAITGVKILDHALDCDFIVAGIHPIRWQRTYNSLDQRTGSLGAGWSHPFETSLSCRVDAGKTDAEVHQFTFTDWAGQVLDLGEVGQGQMVTYPKWGLHVYYIVKNERCVQFILQTTQGMVYVFESVDTACFTLVQIRDRNENTLFLDYDSHQRLTQISDVYGDLRLLLDYDLESGRLITVRQVNEEEKCGRTLVSYEYEDGRLVKVKKGGYFLTRTFTYNTSGLLAMHEDPHGLKSFYEWALQTLPDHSSQKDKETKWRVVTHWLEDPHGKILEHYALSYDFSRRMLTVHQQDVGTSIYFWNEHYRIINYQNVLNEQWHFIYQDDRLMKTIDPHGHSYQYHYNEMEQIDAITDPMERTAHSTWHRYFALPVYQCDFEGHEWFYSYDDYGNLLQVTSPDEDEIFYQYNKYGLVDQIRNDRKKIKQYDYNRYGLPVRIIDATGNETRIGYNHWQNVEMITDALGVAIEYETDEFGRLMMVKLADDRKQSYYYDRALRVTYIKVFGGFEHRYEYNCRGQVVNYQDPKGHMVHFNYDALGRLLSLENEKRGTYAFQYDLLNRLVVQKDISGIETHYQYDQCGNMVTYTQYAIKESQLEFSPIHYQFKYDILGRVIEKANHENIHRYDYTNEYCTIRRYQRAHWRSIQNVEEMATECYDELLFAYNAYGQLKREHNHAGVFTYQYDAFGNLLEQTFLDGTVLQYHHNFSGYLTAINLLYKEHNQPIVSFTRDARQREVERIGSALQYTYHYDITGKIESKSCNTLTSLALPLCITESFKYDTADNLVRHTLDYGDSEIGQTFSSDETISYDALGQITQSLCKGVEKRYQYDPSGNVLVENSVLNYSQVLQHGNFSYSYDGFGRIQSRKMMEEEHTQHFCYDSEQRLVKVAFSDHAQIDAIYFHYDALGRRLQKRVCYHDPECSEEMTHFSWSRMKLIGEENNRTDHRILYIYNGSYEAVARIIYHSKEDHTGQVQYFYTMLNGTPQALINESGQIIWCVNLDTWGAVAQETETEDQLQKRQNLRFQGQYHDRETGLHYHIFRYYDPQAGCYIQPNPAGIQGDLNPYRFVPNTHNWVDPWGLTYGKRKINDGGNPGLKHRKA